MEYGTSGVDSDMETEFGNPATPELDENPDSPDAAFDDNSTVALSSRSSKCCNQCDVDDNSTVALSSCSSKCRKQCDDEMSESDVPSVSGQSVMPSVSYQALMPSDSSDSDGPSDSGILLEKLTDTDRLLSAIKRNRPYNLRKIIRETRYTVNIGDILNNAQNVYEFPPSSLPRHRMQHWQQTVNHRMIRAASVNNIELLEKMLRIDRFDPNCCDVGKRTPLHHAANKGYKEAVSLLLEHSANPNLKDDKGNIPLHLAATNHHMEVVTLLLKGGTDVTCCDNKGRNALHLAQSQLLALSKYADLVCHGVKDQINAVIDMLMIYFNKQRNSSDITEQLLNDFQTKVQVSDSNESLNTVMKSLLDTLLAFKPNISESQ